MATISAILSTFKIKIEEAVGLVPNMMAEEKLKAVQFWNIVSERLQEIVNNSAADISALAFEMEKQQEPVKPSDPNQATSALDHQDDLPLPGLTPQLSPPPSLPPPLSDHAVQHHHPPTLYSLDGRTDAEPSPPITKRESNQTAGTPVGSNEHLSYDPAPTNGRSADDSRLSPEQLLENCPTQASAPAATTDMQGLMLPDNGKFAGVKEETDRKPPVGGRSKRTRPSVKSKSSIADKTNQLGEKNKADVSLSVPRRQPPRSKRRQKNFALTAADSEDDSGSGGAIVIQKLPKIEELAATTKNQHNLLPPPATEPICDPTREEESNGTSGIVLTDAKSLRGTPQENDCFLDNDDENDEDEDEEEEEEEEDGEPALPEESPTLNEQGHYVCFYCKKVFETLSGYSSHKYVHTKPYGCTECLSRFSTKGNLIVHLRRHTGEKPFTCFQCHAKFSTKGNLKRHVKTHSGERPWECPQCGGRFTEKKSLKVHLRRHTGEKPYKCSICGKSFAQTGILQTHLAMHNDEKEHLCEHCGKSFRQKSQLRLHMMRHAGVRKYQCHQCPSRFLTKGDLERHNRIHTGERPFVCELCGKTFTRQQSLNEHNNRHYGLKPYQCKYCSKGFAEMSACYKHIKQHERLPGGVGSNVAGSGAGADEATGNDIDVVGDEMAMSARLPGDEEEEEEEEEDDDEDDRHSVTINCDSQKYTVLVQTDQALDVGSEISVVHNERVQGAPPDELGGDQEPGLVGSRLGDFTAINLLANASSFQHTF